MKKRILYVEDTPQNMLLVKRIVEAMGHGLLEATDGKSGWETILREQPDVILMDLRLPGLVTGFDLIRQTKQHPDLRHIPVVVLTAYGHEEAEKEAIAAGCDGFLRKPADIRQIRAAVNQFLASPSEPSQDKRASQFRLDSLSYRFI
ncbi:MAG: response regulator [Anaerolineae bacterium]